MIQRVMTAILLLAASLVTYAQLEVTEAQAYFREAQALCERDGGRLWGMSLCGPMVIADAATNTIATSQPAPPGDRPAALGFANAPVNWGGTAWSAYMWANFSNSDTPSRGRLLIHELFHRVQPELKLMAQAGPNDHLDTL